ncbi:choice-of-anchor Q domain-containing protein [Marivirga salinae]|uniref:Choice-of-anchor Q domain-containing protein n=1 Tax=Marivirga salinarum TaxID=3059078 RepID=A0AA51REE6_9BACT|nr:choice-of-anchor Q domain-containing protein [Marivirga sp. BDSF4-3]WMN12314.1 choice-of-anchor Q domain-containing protein [Marivirga sp. BDSF4-3]
MPANWMKRLNKGFLFVFCGLSILGFASCSYEPEPTTEPINLSFSTDTLQFDTLFAERLSITKRLKIRNPSNKAVNISNIGFRNQSQAFQLTLNGRTQASFSDQLLLPEDSLLLLVSANIDQGNENNPFVIRDYLEVVNQSNSQSVVFEAWGQNANYLSDTILDCNTRWNSDKPYVLSGVVQVDSSCVLSIEPGTRIYSATETFLIINGSLQAEGNLENPIIFTNDRLDEPFASAPGQWGGIVFLEDSKNNYFKYTTIKNALFGVNLNIFNPDNEPDLTMENCFVGNMAISSVISLNSDFAAVNSLFYNTATRTVSHTGGGSAYYTHCTIANYFNTTREVPAAFFSDLDYDNDENEILDPMEVQLLNNIIYGRINDEIQFFEQQTGNLTLSFSHNLFKSSIEILSENNSIRNQDPSFVEIANEDFRLGEGSPAIDAALSTEIMSDIQGESRGAAPDIGAFEYVEIEE